MVNVIVVQGEVDCGPGMPYGTFQGSSHSTRDLLISGDFTLRATKAELERRSLRYRLSCFADDWTLQDLNSGVECVIVLHNKLDARGGCLGRVRTETS